MKIAPPHAEPHDPGATISAQLGIRRRVGRVIDLSNPGFDWSDYQVSPPPPVPVFRDPHPEHWDQADTALRQFEESAAAGRPDWTRAASALVHALLSIDVTQSGNR
jgi:hypothetical protein